MVSLTDKDGEFCGFFDTEGEALMHATIFGVAGPFTITTI